MSILKERIKEERKIHGLTQQKLAALLNVDRSSISRWENGKGEPNLDDLRKPCIIFETTADELLGTRFSKNTNNLSE